MMYHHHGLSYDFTGNYDEYFGMNTDVDAVVYLMLVNNLLHDLFPNCITVGKCCTTCSPTASPGVSLGICLLIFAFWGSCNSPTAST